MNFNNSEIEQVEVSIKQAKEMVAMRDALIRLDNNADFKLIITDHYFKTYAANLVMCKSDPRMESEDEQKRIDNSIIAVGELKQYFNSIVIRGNTAERSIKEDEATLDELYKEQL